jgi:hypothetical protein
MWQRFTERARRVVFFAQEEAARLGENYVGSEHLLLGLVREDDSVACRILDRLGIPLGKIRSEIEKQVTKGQGHQEGQDMQLTPRAKRVIDLAYEEARQLNHNYIGTEHLLLGLIREGDGLGARVLVKLGADLERTRAIVHEMMEGEGGAKPKPASLKVRIPRGDLGLLLSEPSRPKAEVAHSQAAAEELRDVLQTKDHHGYREMLAGGRIRLLPAGTQVKLLRIEQNDLFYIRILGGEADGQLGWVLAQQFHHTGRTRGRSRRRTRGTNPLRIAPPRERRGQGRVVAMVNLSPQPPPRSGEGELRRSLHANTTPLPVSGRGLGEGFFPKGGPAATDDAT